MSYNIVEYILIFPYMYFCNSQRKWWSAPRHEAGLQRMDNLRFCSDHHGVVSEAYGVYKENENLAFRYEGARLGIGDGRANWPTFQ